jgi:hypothetical protein
MLPVGLCFTSLDPTRTHLLVDSKDLGRHGLGQLKALRFLTINASTPCDYVPDILPWLYTELSTPLISPLPLQVLVVHFKPLHDVRPILDPSLWTQLVALLANREVLPELSSFALHIVDLQDVEVFLTAFKALGEPKVLGHRRFIRASSNFMLDKGFDTDMEWIFAKGLIE